MTEPSMLLDRICEHTEANEHNIILKILRYLNASELREARLVNSTFNEIISNNPILLWNKNMMTVHFPWKVDSLDKWIHLRIHRLVLLYKCPNFHFVKTNLLSEPAIDFFQSSLRYQIKHLKITKCRITLNLLIYIMACCSGGLEHLEIIDFSKLEKPGNRVYPEIRTSLQNLKTLIFENRRGEGRTLNSITQGFLYNLLSGARQLSKIRFFGWGAKSCENLVHVMCHVAPENLQELESLELGCVIDPELTPLRQYSFIMRLESLYLPRLTHFSLRFNQKVEPSEGLTEHFIQDLTQCVASFVEASSLSLETIEFINCPLSNVVFRKGADFFPSLVKLNTEGTRISQLDEDGNPVREFYPKMKRSLKNRSSLFSGKESETETERKIGFRYSREDVYKIVCATFVFCGMVHLSMRYLFPVRLANHWEAIIHASIAWFVFMGRDVQKLWDDAAQFELR